MLGEMVKNFRATPRHQGPSLMLLKARKGNFGQTPSMLVMTPNYFWIILDQGVPILFSTGSLQSTPPSYQKVANNCNISTAQRIENLKIFLAILRYITQKVHEFHQHCFSTFQLCRSKILIYHVKIQIFYGHSKNYPNHLWALKLAKNCP